MLHLDYMLYSIRIGSLAYVTMIINNDFSLLSTWFDHNKLLATDEKTRRKVQVRL